MLDHLLCRCGHLKQMHGRATHSECRICERVWHGNLVHPCYRFRWRWLPVYGGDAPQGGNKLRNEARTGR